MNEIDSTIKWLVSGTWRQDIETTKAIAVIMDVLREKQEREKGCGFCNSRLGIAAHHINEAGLQAGTRKSANFCPMCGRKLDRPPERSEG